MNTAVGPISILNLQKVTLDAINTAVFSC